MSYALQLFPAKAGVDPRTIDAEYVEAMEAGERGPPDPAADARMQTLSAALRTQNPALTATSAARFRLIELNGPERGNGIQILLFATGASISIPYWHTGDAARAAWREIWTYLRMLETEGALHTWDPQLDAVLSLESDFEMVLDTYQADVRSVYPKLAEPRPAPEPWWRFWKRGGR